VGDAVCLGYSRTCPDAKVPASLLLLGLKSGRINVHAHRGRNYRLFSNFCLVDEGNSRRRRVKEKASDNMEIGQGGKLDPLADGVIDQCNFKVSRELLVIKLCVEGQCLLVVGVGESTRKLNDFLDCAKVRVAFAGCSLTPQQQN
jgi:hypothetical protein